MFRSQHDDQPVDESLYEKEMDDAARLMGVRGAYWHMSIDDKSDYLEKKSTELEHRARTDDEHRADKVRKRMQLKLLQREKERDRETMRKILGECNYG